LSPDERVVREVLAEMRRQLMHGSLVGTLSARDRDVIECFLVDYEQGRGLRP
jgi:hypothetical protein